MHDEVIPADEVTPIYNTFFERLPQLFLPVFQLESLTWNRVRSSFLPANPTKPFHFFFGSATLFSNRLLVANALCPGDCNFAITQMALVSGTDQEARTEKVGKKVESVSKHTMRSYVSRSITALHCDQLPVSRVTQRPITLAMIYKQ